MEIPVKATAPIKRPTGPMVTSTLPRYPFADAPDVLRSHQKDTAFQEAILERLTDIARGLFGARFIHDHLSEFKTSSSLLYLACTTLLGNRTLGEEYCDITQVEDESHRHPSVLRRSSYIFFSVLCPYLFTKLVPALRNRLRQALEQNLARGLIKSHGFQSSLSHRMQSYVLENLATMTSPTPLYAIGLSLFYLSGAYYQLGKRIVGLRYILTKRIEASDQRMGYEVLGVLLIIQMLVQGWLHLQTTLEKPAENTISSSVVREDAIMNGNLDAVLQQSASERSQLLSASSIPNSGGQNRVAQRSHTPFLAEPRYALADEGIMAWIEGKQQRKCTLCLEKLKDPSATSCGHVFCYTCIMDSIRESSKCPLCRQAILAQHVLPLRG